MFDLETVAQWVLYFTVFSVVGYFIEVILCSIGQKRVANRGFLFGPYLPIYGFGGILIMLATAEIRDNFTLTFLVAMAVCSALEYMTSFLMEKIFHLRWWDYRGEKFNLNGRICLRNSLAFGIGGCILVYSALPIVDNILDFLSKEWSIGIAIFCAVVFLLDTVVSSYATDKAKYMADFDRVIGDQTAEIKKQVHKAIKQIFVSSEKARKKLEKKIAKAKKKAEKRRAKLQKKTEKRKAKLQKKTAKRKK